jgi:hypothetical protein
MSAWDWVRVFAILGPISILLLVGFVLSIRSGAMHEPASRPRGLTLAAFSRTLFTVGGYIVGLAVIHQLVGQHLPTIW